MKPCLRLGPQFVWCVALLAFSALGWTQETPGSAGQVNAAVRIVRVVMDRDSPAVEVISNRPLTPAIQKLDNPSRLVIDLPNATLVQRRKRLDFRSDQISGVRVDQFQAAAPAIVRVVVDLLSPTSYTWDAAGNRLMVRLHADESARKAETPTVPALTSGPTPVVVPVSPGTSGNVVLAGSRVATGSSVSAGVDTAILRLGRGGEVHVCPGTTVSVTASPDGRTLMLGMSTGALEAHYKLEASADSVVTPDFRILLAGPGEFHYAISADSRGNTCVRALPGNTASVIVNELMGDGTYQVKPAEQIVFHSGRLTAASSTTPAGCGCPPAPVPVMRTSTPDAPPIPEDKLPASVRLAQPGDDVKPVPPPESGAGLRSTGAPPSQVTLSVTGPETAALPPSKPDDVHVQVDAPLVFRANDPPPAPPAPTREAQQLPVTMARAPAALQTTVTAPPAPAPAQNKPEHHGVFGKIKGFFAAIFR
jgi:AMIN domain-containing protein